MPVTFNQNLSANTLRTPSMALWGRCPRKPFSGGDFNVDGSGGTWFEDDFNMAGNATMSSAYAGSAGQWSVYGYAGTQVNDGTLEGGVIKIGADGDNEGTAYLGSAGGFRFITTGTGLAYNRRMWFESRWSRSTITTDRMDVFVGLMLPALATGLPAAAQPITTTDDTLMTAGSLFGFHSNSNTGTRGGPTEIAAAFVLTSGTVNYPTNCTTMMASTGQTVLAADSYVKTGWLFDPRPAQKRLITAATARQTAGNYAYPVIQFFINGVVLPTFLTADDVQNSTSAQAFPTSFMTPCFAVMNTDASSNTLNMDWIACYQEGNT